ncbi:hypothetical protein Dimus_025154 [Dionaea muscipula]
MLKRNKMMLLNPLIEKLWMMHMERKLNRKLLDKKMNDNKDDDMLLSSKIEVLRSKEGIDDDDDVILSIKYQPSNQNLIPVAVDVETVAVHDDDIEVEVIGEKPVELESKFKDNSLVYFGADGQSFRIEDVDTYMNFIIEDAANKILEEEIDKVEMEYVKQLVNEDTGDDVFLTGSRDTDDDVVSRV